jgi:hypothetical protein
MWLAEMESESFSWKGFGDTEQEAKEAILNAWNNGDGSAFIEEMTLEELEEFYDIDTYEFEAGTYIIR